MGWVHPATYPVNTGCARLGTLLRLALGYQISGAVCPHLFIYVYVLFSGAVSSSDYAASNGGMNIWIGYASKRSWPNLRYYLGIRLEDPRDEPHQGNRCRGRDANVASTSRIQIINVTAWDNTLRTPLSSPLRGAKARGWHNVAYIYV
jgi:hypothetical protein